MNLLVHKVLIIELLGANRNKASTDVGGRLLLFDVIVVADFSQAQQRQYERLTKQMEPDMVAYEKTKEEMGEKFYPGVNTIIHGHKPSEAAIDRMVQDLDKQ